MPPSGAVINTYLPCFTAHVVRSRHVSRFVNALASGPVISTMRSTLTSQSVTSLTNAQYSSTGSPYVFG